MIRSKCAAGAVTRFGALLAGCLALTPSAWAWTLSEPVVHGRLAVYFIRDAGALPSRLETLDRALDRGEARVLETKGGPQVENLSDNPLFVPFGTLLRGGLQDQVVSGAAIVPPHVGPLPLDTYCIDPFRSKPRDGESGATFSGTNLLFPFRSAKLSMLVGRSASDRVAAMRQAGVWWSIDTLRSRLARRTGAELAPPTPARWDRTQPLVTTRRLAARDGAWLDGLPLALGDERLDRLTRPAVEALARPDGLGRDIVGAAFAVDATFIGAEIVRSPDLFEALWPAMLRSSVIESLAEPSSEAASPPRIETVRTILDTASVGPAAERRVGAIHVRDGASVLAADAVDAAGRVVETTILPKPDPALAAQTPDGVILRMLATGRADGTALDDLPDPLVMVANAARDHWSVEFPPQLTGWERMVAWGLDAVLVGFWLHVAFVCFRGAGPVAALHRWSASGGRAAIRGLILAQRAARNSVRSARPAILEVGVGQGGHPHHPC